MQPLEHYDITPDRGYLCRFDAGAITLPDIWQPLRSAAMDLPALLPTGRVRALLADRLPLDDLAATVPDLTEAQARLAMVHCSFLVQAWVWGEATPADRLPAALAQPIVALADRLGQQPLLPYSGYVLDNWAKIDPAGGITLDNIRMIQPFLSGQDEAWFVLIHVAIEARAGQALARMPQVVQAVAQDDAARVTTLLEEIAQVWAGINAIFDRMPDRCDPYIYFERVRPYIHGWRDNPALPHGVVYEGTRYGTEGQAFRGQTGSQSSIVPAMDALFGVGHAPDPMKDFLDQLHQYRPPQHRAFIDDLRTQSGLRAFAETRGDRALTDAYNANLQAVADFRARHLEYAASYINKQGLRASGNHTDVGTGGTPFMRYLKKHRDETAAQMLALPALPRSA